MHFSRILTLIFILSVSACGGKGEGVSGWGMLSGNCFGYDNPADSDYILPYSTGESVYLSQGNCSQFTHNGDQNYAYDFAMAIGDTVIASRGGTVVVAVDGNPNGNGGTEANAVVINHGDGTYAVYGHLSPGLSVSVGNVVNQGDTLGTSGNSGYSTGPHLHFHVMDSNEDTIPVNFSNASPLHRSPRTGTFYTATAKLLSDF